MNKLAEKHILVHENFLDQYKFFIGNKDCPFVLDGQNYVFNLPRKVQKEGLITLIDQISLLNHPMFLILPDFLIKRYNLNKEFLDQKFCILIRIDNHKLDDWGILDLALQFQGFIISNDHYQQFKPYYPKELYSRLIEFIAFAIHGKILLKVPFIEFINLQTKKQTYICSSSQERSESIGPGFLSSSGSL